MRVLRWFARSGLIEPDDVREMLAWGNRLCSVDAGVCVAAQDRAGLKHVLHYFARPLYVRFVEHCCCLRPMVRCPLLADSGLPHRPAQVSPCCPRPDVGQPWAASACSPDRSHITGLELLVSIAGIG